MKTRPTEALIIQALTTPDLLPRRLESLNINPAQPTMRPCGNQVGLFYFHLLQ
jgi:hypothetical protein